MIIPIFAGLDRIPNSLLEASADLGGRAGITFRRVILPLVLPGGRRRLDLHVLPDPGRLHHPDPRLEHPVHRQRHYDFVGVAGNQPLAAAYALVPVTIMLVYLLVARRLGAFEAL